MSSIDYTEADHQEWNDYKIKFNKTYENDNEDQNRKRIYFSNKKAVEAHNKKYEAGEVTWTMGINQFSDLTKEEFQNRHLGHGVKKQTPTQQ